MATDRSAYDRGSGTWFDRTQEFAARGTVGEWICRSRGTSMMPSGRCFEAHFEIFGCVRLENRPAHL
jgi:hypothetical protein